MKRMVLCRFGLGLNMPKDFIKVPPKHWYPLANCMVLFREWRILLAEFRNSIAKTWFSSHGLGQSTNLIEWLIVVTHFGRWSRQVVRWVRYCSSLLVVPRKSPYLPWKRCRRRRGLSQIIPVLGSQPGLIRLHL